MDSMTIGQMVRAAGAGVENHPVNEHRPDGAQIT